MVVPSDQLDVLAECTGLMDRWTKECFQGSATPMEILTKLCEIVEQQTEVYYKTDPDPFDDRHPGRADPNCTLGHVLSNVLKNIDFTHALASTYISREQQDLNVVTCRLLLSLMPGLEAIALFKEHESSVTRLFTWAEIGVEPLRSYAVGILAFIMEGQEHASTFKESNHKLVPILIQRLQAIIEERKQTVHSNTQQLRRPFAQFSKTKGSTKSLSEMEDKENGDLPSQFVSPAKANQGECSNSSWMEMEPYVINSYQIFPVTEEVQQRLILSYLTPMGEYQELLPEVFQFKVMDLLFHYLDYQKNCDVRLGFAAARYLASLLCHKKFGIEFINCGGLQRLLKVPRPSLAATGVSLCLYYLAFVDDTMERVCISPIELLAELAEVVLWLLECSHQSGRMHAVMFLSNALTFKAFLDIFDQMDGLRKLYNVLSTSAVLNTEATDDNDFTDDQMYAFRQSIRHVSYALKKYFDSHAFIMADKIKNNYDRDTHLSLKISPYKAINLSSDILADSIEILLDCLVERYWKPAAVFHKLSGIQLFMKTIALIADWPPYTGKADSVRWLLDTLTVCSVYPPIQLELCQTIILRDGTKSPSISILLGMADADILSDPEVQKSALAVINNLVCAPAGMPHALRKNRKSTPSHNSPNFLQTLWDEFRQNNGIMELLKLVQIQSPLTGADAIRALACKALVGLSRSENMCQIMSKLPLFNNGLVLSLMKEPVLQDKRIEHVKFCKYGTELIERVCGRPENFTTDISLKDIRRADVVSQTRIVYKEKELLQLIHDHLIQNGLEESAQALQKEASLPVRPPAVSLPSHLYESPISSKHKPASVVRQAASHISQLPNTPGPSRSTPLTPGSIKFHLGPKTPTQSSSQAIRNTAVRSSRSNQEVRLLANKRSALINPCEHKSDTMTLDKIITSYLRKQHALCKNPVVMCPPFSLFEPHVCLEPSKKNLRQVNIAARALYREIHEPNGIKDSVAANRKFKYSRFKAIKTYKDSEGGSNFTCCSFSACEQWLMLGTTTGDLKLYNVQTGDEAETYNCHHSPLVLAEPSKDGLLLLTSSSWGRPLSALWSMDNFFDQKTGFAEDQYVEFSKQVQDRIVGTCDYSAKVYDVATGELIRTFYDPTKANNYLRNQATFNYTDDLVLNDGVLWDVNAGQVIHKFDKFNPYVSGVFHPMGLEVIINSEIWDLRTYKLLHTVPALNQCQIRFSHDSTVLYGAMIPHDEEEDQVGNLQTLYGSSFRTFDARTYNCLSTIDVKRSIYDLCTDKSDLYLAVIETQKDNDSLQEDSFCRMYEIGAIKTSDDMVPEEEEEEHGEEDEDDDDDDDDEGNASDVEIQELVDERDAEDDETSDSETLAQELESLLNDQREIERTDNDNGGSENIVELLNSPPSTNQITQIIHSESHGRNLQEITDAQNQHQNSGSVASVPSSATCQNNCQDFSLPQAHPSSSTQANYQSLILNTSKSASEMFQDDVMEESSERMILPSFSVENLATECDSVIYGNNILSSTAFESSNVIISNVPHSVAQSSSSSLSTLLQASSHIQVDQSSTVNIGDEDMDANEDDDDDDISSTDDDSEQSFNLFLNASDISEGDQSD